MLPRQLRKPAFAARANDQVGIGLPSHVEVTSDRGWSHRLDGFGERFARNGSFPQQRANRIGDLVVATVRNSNRQCQTIVVAGGRLFCGTDRRNGRGGQHLEPTSSLHANPLLMDTWILGERRHLGLDGGKDT